MLYNIFILGQVYKLVTCNHYIPTSQTYLL